MQQLISAYNVEADRFDSVYQHGARQERAAAVDNFLAADAGRISWTHNLKQSVVTRKRFAFDDSCMALVTYRPFMRACLYYSRDFNERVYQMPRIFPLGTAEVRNRFIAIPGPGNVTPFSVLMGDTIFDLSVIAAKSGTQCFPRYLFDDANEQTDPGPQGALFANSTISQGVRRDAITDCGMKRFTEAYQGETIAKDDLFHYVYGLLHSEDYRERYADNLTKQLPRIPLMKRAAEFWAFVEAGRALGDLHVGYETVEPYPVTIAEGDLRLAHIADPVSYFRVEKMKFAGKRGAVDKSTVIYNPRITMTNIPLEAYDYVVNGKSALDWVIERQCVKTDAASGIVNDANRYANETVGDPAYPLNLFRRVITVSLETMKIVRGLPALDILEPASETLEPAE
jgi:predicted helicase